MNNEDGEREADALNETDPRYRRAARLLAQKLGVDWRTLPAEQVREYARKIEIARVKGKPAPDEK